VLSGTTMSDMGETSVLTEPTAADIVIGGVEPFSMVDWPGHLSATLFLQGCPWRCTYCHNPALQSPRVPGTIAWQDVITLLETRTGKLDAVVFSGGEPTRQAALLPAIHAVRAMGFNVGLHTAGAFPARLARVLPLVDWVGLDVKASPHLYGEITGIDSSGERAWQSLDLVRRSGVDFEVRITVDPTIQSRGQVLSLIDQLSARGIDRPVLQEVRPDGTNPEYAQALGGRRLFDVLPHEDHPELERR